MHTRGTQETHDLSHIIPGGGRHGYIKENLKHLMNYCHNMIISFFLQCIHITIIVLHNVTG